MHFPSIRRGRQKKSEEIVDRQEGFHVEGKLLACLSAARLSESGRRIPRGNPSVCGFNGRRWYPPPGTFCITQLLLTPKTGGWRQTKYRNSRMLFYYPSVNNFLSGSECTWNMAGNEICPIPSTLTASILQCVMHAMHRESADGKHNTKWAYRTTNIIKRRRALVRRITHSIIRLSTLFAVSSTSHLRIT